jgi:hypothetical protein
VPAGPPRAARWTDTKEIAGTGVACFFLRLQRSSTASPQTGCHGCCGDWASCQCGGQLAQPAALRRWWLSICTPCRASHSDASGPQSSEPALPAAPAQSSRSSMRLRFRLRRLGMPSQCARCGRPPGAAPKKTERAALRTPALQRNTSARSSRRCSRPLGYLKLTCTHGFGSPAPLRGLSAGRRDELLGWRVQHQLRASRQLPP